MNRWEFEQKIVIKALKDPAFKKQLLASPKETVREFLKNEKVANLSLFDRINIKVVEEQKGEWVLAVPSWAPEKPVTDAELEQMVAGAMPGNLVGPSLPPAGKSC